MDPPSSPGVQIRTNGTKVGWDSDSYYMFNVPETEFDTENNCKSPTDCPDDDEGRDDAPWTAVSQHTQTDYRLSQKNRREAILLRFVFVPKALFCKNLME